MKRIVAVVDVKHFRDEQLDVFAKIADLLNGQLKVLLLEAEAGQVEAPGQQPAESGTPPRHAAADIAGACGRRGITIASPKGKGYLLKEITRESRFADLLLISRSTATGNLFRADAPGFIKDVPADAQCAVLVLPDLLRNIREVVFAYNGSFSSVYAMKRFMQLAPLLADKKATVIYVPEEGIPIVPNELLLKEYLGNYFTDFQCMVLNGLPDAEIRHYLHGREDCLLVMGAYGRNTFSRFFNPGNARNMLRMLDVPVFFTHP